MAKNLITIFEHDYIVRDGEKLSHPDFDGLYSYVCNENQKSETNNSLDTWLLKPCFKNGKQALKATQYIGIIQFGAGVVLEILPKIFKPPVEDSQTPEEQARELVLKMLRTLKSAKFKNIHRASLNVAKMHLLDVFIWMFLDEVDSIVKQGIKSKYIEQQENLNFFKGKLLVSQNITKNMGLMHKNYMQYDEYLPNIPENRLIKSALGYLLKNCKSSSLFQGIRKLYFIFDEVSNSLDFEQDYALCNKNSRIFSHYQNALEWAMVFLAGNSFTTQVGSHNVKSLLFDMNKLFEDYVAHHVRNIYSDVYAQRHDHHLVYVSGKETYNSGKMKLIPDLQFKLKRVNEPNKLIIADTKWKRIKEDKDLSQADFYQMFAYYSKYQKQNEQNNIPVEIWLIYPKHEELDASKITQHYRFYKAEGDNNNSAEEDNENWHLRIKFFDFENNQLVENK